MDLPPGQGDDPLHREPGRAHVGADANRLRRPPERRGRARGHGDHLGQAGARERAARPRFDQPARAARRRRCCTRRSRRCTSPGHACSEELRTLLSLVRPKALMPIHGEYRMLAAHAKLGRDAGIPASAIVIAENGSVVELTPRGVGIVDRISAGVTFVDGLGVGDVQDVALRDRRRLSEDGVLIVVTTRRRLGRRRDRAAGADRPRLRRERGAARRAARRGRPDRRGARARTGSTRSSSCRSTCTTRSRSWSIPARAAGR